MLLEALVACVILVVALLGTFLLLDLSAKTSAATRAREGATNLAREILEDAHSIPFSEVDGSISERLKKLPALEPNPPGPAWQIQRRRYTYTVTVQECSVDDPKDGLGKHDGTFCAGESEGSEDAVPIDLKRVTARVSWIALARSHEVVEVQTLGSAGQELGLSASQLQLASTTPASTISEPTAPTITSPTVTTLNFSAAAPPGTAEIVWSLDGAVQSRTPVRSGTAEWSWTISGVSDGTYQVGAQAEQSNGVVGPSVSIPVTLNRSVPTNPGGVMGGFNNVYVSTEATQTPVAELQWQANSERNVIGYRVFNPSGKEVCPGSPSTLSLELSCVDLNPPAPSASNLTYRVVPLYRDAGGAVAEGLATNFTLNGTPLSTYTLAPSTLNTGTNCSGASAKKDMLLSYTPGTDVATNETTVFCSNSFTAGATTQLGGTATVYLENKSTEKACTVTGELTVNGTITGPLKVENTIPKASAISPYKFSFAYKALPEPWPAGRFDLLLKFGSGCSAGTKLHYGSATYPSSFQTAPKPSPAPPNRPASLMLTPESGTVVLSWPAPSGGTAVSFYRIYRDGKLYTKRYDTANATETSYTDPNHTEKHSYYITAVSSTLAESEFLGPVSG